MAPAEQLPPLRGREIEAYEAKLKQLWGEHDDVSDALSFTDCKPYLHALQT